MSENRDHAQTSADADGTDTDRADGADAPAPRPAEPRIDPHAQSLMTLADAMFRTALWPSLGTAVAGIVLFGVINGLPGALGALVGGVLACASSLLTLVLMRKTAAQGPHVAMAASLGGSILKLFVLMLIMMGLRGIEALDSKSLGITMIAVVIVAAGAEAIAFRRTRLPTLIIAEDD